MRMRRAVKVGFGVLIAACAFLEATPARAALTQRCNWGVGALGPSVWPASNQVMMMPTVMDLGGPPFGTSKVAFVSFETLNDITSDKRGVLRIMDLNCNEIARFPGTGPPPPIPVSCLSHYANLNTVPHLSPGSGLALGNIDNTPGVEIIGVLDDHATNNGGIIAFRLVAGKLVPQWCSAPLPVGDVVPSFSAPAIAQLDKTGTPFAQRSEIIVDNKVFDANGSLRYTGFSVGGSNCATFGGPPCPRSQTTVIANLLGPGSLPQVITGRGFYKSSNAAFWTGSLGWVSSSVSNANNPSHGGLAYPAIAELDPSPGPEIVVVDSPASKLRVLSASGTQLTWIPLPNGTGGPPMIGDADSTLPGPEIGVASLNNYTVFKYHPGFIPNLTILWSKPTQDLSGATTSTLYNPPTGGARIYYNDQQYLRVFDGANGASLQIVPNSSLTYIEGPIVSAFDPSATGTVIVSANNVGCSLLLACVAGGQQGVRIFDDPAIGKIQSYWNQHTYHVTNVTNSLGAIPVGEAPSWLPPARNTYRVQQ